MLIVAKSHYINKFRLLRTKSHYHHIYQSNPSSSALTEITSSLRRSVLRVQIPQQPPKSSLVAVVVLPPAEIPNVPCAADGRRPSLRSVYERIVYADREQHQPLLPSLPLQCGFYFIL